MPRLVLRELLRCRRGFGPLVCLATLLACEPKEDTSNPPVEEAAPAQESNTKVLPAAPTSESLTETVGERSSCRSGRMEVPGSGAYLRAVKDDAHGYSVLLPDLNDWHMACGDAPYMVASAMGGAINATVSSVTPPGALEVEDYLDLFGEQLEKDLLAEKTANTDGKTPPKMSVSAKMVTQTDAGNWVLTFKVSAKVDGTEIWQFNYITARKRGDGSIVSLHIAVTARHTEGDDNQVHQFAAGLVDYMDFFRVDA